MKTRLLLLILLTAFTSLLANAKNSTPGTGEESISKTDIAGGVIHGETKKGLSNVIVTAYLSSKKEKVAITDGAGNYSFDDLKPGTYKFVFEKDGFKKITKDKVVVKTDEAFQLNVELNEHATFEFMPNPSHIFDFD
jgi:hypothetical protein